MSTFALALPPKVLFGPGAAAGLAGHVAAMGTRPLIVTGSAPDRVAPVLAGVDAACSLVVSGEPTVTAVRAAVQAARAADCDVVVAIGGGSVIDLAKAVAMLLANGGDPLDYLEVVGRGLPIRAASRPLIALPTTAGTGAEVTANAVLSSDGVKASLRSPTMVPSLAIVDPELAVGCPPQVTAFAGMDALTQCLEPYVSTKANPVTDGWARTGLLAAGRGLRRAIDDGSDLAARTDQALCSLMGGLALANAKLGAVHGFASAVGGMSDAPHGAICAALVAPVCQANIAAASPALLGRYADVARWLTGDASARAGDAVAWLEQTVDHLQIPRLATYGLSGRDVEEVLAKTIRASSTAGNPVVLSREALRGAFLAAL